MPPPPWSSPPVPAHPVGPLGLQDGPQPGQHGRGHLGGGLVVLHYVQVIVGHDAEEPWHLAEHLPGLGGYADHRPPTAAGVRV